jgi:hypothetical protein
MGQSSATGEPLCSLSFAAARCCNWAARARTQKTLAARHRHGHAAEGDSLDSHLATLPANPCLTPSCETTAYTTSR